ncbi:Abi family protein [Streptomyces durocortorensis]|uniref:Abi family protein n=1 Tax=Streptomyces durocortorensis TaxID=2811104 RepID=A0ABS2HW79_9ACTN|nr:Abi family protein [Streptomyces durocortorensis]MBM7054962.1 Abi family protein [Streptomyces durocortorensis]
MAESSEEQLVAAISPERFLPFLEECHGDVVVALRLYAWDAEVARALYSPLRDLEVSLRNRVHRQLTGKFGRSDWWNLRRAEPNSWGMRKIRGAEDELAERGEFSPSDVVASMSFGFWVSLVSKGGHGNYDMRYWNPALRHCFNGVGRQNLHDRLGIMRTLRNRIAHHERVCHRRLEEDFRTAVELTALVAPALAARHEKYSQVPAVLARKARVLSGEEEIVL